LSQELAEAVYYEVILPVLFFGCALYRKSGAKARRAAREISL
jgi:hypothetical protein